MVLSAAETRKKRESWVGIVHSWWHLNRIWLLTNTPRTLNGNADKSGVYSGKRVRSRKSIKVRLCITAGDGVIARGLEKSGLGLCRLPSVRLWQECVLAFRSGAVVV